jgi:hypothetical protein
VIETRPAALAGVAALVLALSFAGAGAGATPAAGTPTALDRPVDGAGQVGVPQVTVTNVTVDPARPVAGEPFTVETTVENRGRTAYWIEGVALRAPADAAAEEYARVRDAGSLTPGSRLAVPLTQQFGEPGSYRMRVVVYLGGPGSAPRQVQYPLVVDVVDPGERGPTVDVDVGEAVVGAGTTVDVTVANDLPSDVVGGALTLSGPGLDVEDPRRAFASLDRGASLNESFDVVPTRTGRLSANLSVTYTRADGERRRFVEPVALDVAAGAVRLDARVEPSAGGRVVVANVTNGRAVPVSGVRLHGRSANASLSGSLTGPVPPGESRSVTLPLDPAAAGTVPLTATYRFDGRVGRARDRVRVSDAPAEIALTGVVVRRDGDRVHLSGSASNVGLQTANGVLVGVVDTDAVTPAPPQRDYFVGQVGVSNFVAFDVYAAVEDDGVDAVPVRVSYLTDGQRRSTVVEVSLDGAGSRPAATAGGGAGGAAAGANPSGGDSSGAGSGSGGGLPVPLPVLVGAVVAVLAAGGYLVRRRRAGDGS